MAALSYKLDGEEITIEVDQLTADGVYGNDEVLANKDSDGSYGQPWYDEGYIISKLFNKADFKSFKGIIEDLLKDIIKNLGVPTKGFKIENYHKYVSPQQHADVVAKTRDLFSNDFNLSINHMHRNLSSLLGFDLTDTNPIHGGKMHIILRINRPDSIDFNPVHKDMYGFHDENLPVPPLINFWIPICGVNEKSTLAIAPGSHLINERHILRNKMVAQTRQGEETRGCTVMGGNRYRVCNIIHWEGKNDLIKAIPPEGSTLIFSSHLIHGLGINNNDDMTRVALEFRLFRTHTFENSRKILDSVPFL